MRKEVLGAISLDLFAVLFGGATALLPNFARDVLHIGSWGLGLLRSAPSVGALLVSLYLARYPIQRRVGKMMFGSVALYGLATLVFALSRSFPLSMVALALTGAFDMVSVVVRQSLVQLETPNEMRGRVSAVNSIFIGASNQLGQFESGVTAGWLGAVPSVLVGGAGTMLIVVLWMKLFPSLAQKARLTASWRSVSFYIGIGGERQRSASGAPRPERPSPRRLVSSSSQQAVPAQIFIACRFILFVAPQKKAVLSHGASSQHQCGIPIKGWECITASLLPTTYP
jgi:MFS family permease